MSLISFFLCFFFNPLSIPPFFRHMPVFLCVWLPPAFSPLSAPQRTRHSVLFVPPWKPEWNFNQPFLFKRRLRCKKDVIKMYSMLTRAGVPQKLGCSYPTQVGDIRDNSFLLDLQYSKLGGFSHETMCGTTNPICVSPATKLRSGWFSSVLRYLWKCAYSSLSLPVYMSLYVFAYTVCIFMLLLLPMHWVGAMYNQWYRGAPLRHLCK